MKVKARAQRNSPRKELTPIRVSSVSSMENLSKISRGGQLVEASISGFLLRIERDDLIPAILRKNLTLDVLVGQRVMIHLDELNIEVAGFVVRTKFVGKKGFELAVDYSDDSPEYWRECLVDLLPAPGEMDN